MRKHATYGILLCAVASVGNVWAYEEADTAARVLKGLEVSASAPKEATSSAPMRMLERDALQKIGVTDVSDALHRMPGVTLKDYGGAGGLKTVSVRGFGASHTGVVLDGVPLSDVQSGQIDLSRYSIDNVGSVSMIIGDNDDIFTTARIASTPSTISINSMPVTDKLQLEAKLRGGSFGFINPYVKVGAPIGKTAFNAIAEYTHADNNYPFKLKNGIYTTTERRNNSRINSAHGEVNFAMKPCNGTSLNAKVYYFDSRRQLPGPVVYYNNINHERLREQNAMAQAQVKSALTSKLSLMGILKYNFAASLYHDESNKYPNGEINQNYWQREYYAAAALLYMPARQWALDYSADYFFNNLNSNLVTDRHPRRNSVLQTATARYRVNRLSVMARALYSIYLNGAKYGTAAKDAHKLSPSVSVSFQPMASQLLYLRASYKNIFRMPTFNECYFDHLGSQDVQPESTEQVNLGITYTLSNGSPISATFTADAYCNSVKDMIVAVPYNMFLWSMVNLGKVRVLGVDATMWISADIAKRQTITFSGNYSFQRAEPRTNPESSDWGKQVAYIPKHSGSAAISYENPWVNLSVHATGVSDRYTTNNNVPATRIDGYVELGAAAWRNFAIGRNALEVRIDALNFLDKQYCVIAKYPMPGRSFRATIAFKI